MKSKPEVVDTNNPLPSGSQLRETKLFNPKFGTVIAARFFSM